MCAKILNSSLGQLSGKMGGMVFARNKAGAYVRAGVDGINPRTLSQIEARNAFANVASLFRTLSPSEKTSWQEFADNYFSPRSGGNVGQFSGYNAFISLRSVVRGSDNLAKEVVINTSVGELATAIVYPFVPMPETPLAKGFTPGLETVGGDSAQLSLGTCLVNADGTYELGISLNNGVATSLIGNKTVDGYAMGYAVYLSNGNSAEGQTYNNEFATTLGYINPWEAATPLTDLANITGFTFESDTPLKLGNYRRFPLLNEFALITVYGLNIHGMMCVIGTKEVQITA